MFNLNKETHQHTHVSKEAAQIQANAQRSIARERDETDREIAAMRDPETYRMYLQAKKEEKREKNKSTNRVGLVILGVFLLVLLYSWIFG